MPPMFESLNRGAKVILTYGTVLGLIVIIVGVMAWREKRGRLNMIFGLLMILATLAAVLLIPTEILYALACTLLLIWGGIISITRAAWHWEGTILRPIMPGGKGATSLNERLFSPENAREMKRTYYIVFGIGMIMMGVIVGIIFAYYFLARK